eukprot:3239477-Lingulodinium_polyedra.AAC.1
MTAFSTYSLICLSLRQQWSGDWLRWVLKAISTTSFDVLFLRYALFFEHSSPRGQYALCA